MKHTALTASILAIASVISLNANATDIRSVTKQAIENNPEIQVQWRSFQESMENKNQAKAGYLPSIDLNAAYGKGERDFDDRNWFNQGQAEISLTQVLFDGFRIKNKVEQSDYAALKKYYELNAGVEQKALETAQAYMDVQRYRELVGLAQTNYNNHFRVYSQIKQRADQGVGNRADLAQITGRLSLAQTNMMTEQANLNDVTTGYIRLVGQSPDVYLQPVQLNAVIPASRDAAVAGAYENSNSLRAALSEIEYARANAEEYKSNMFPKLSFVARTGLYENRNSFDDQLDPRDYGQDSAVELRLTYNLFNGGADRSATRAANQRMLLADDLKNKACVDLRQTTAIAWDNVDNLNRQMEWLQRHRDESAAVVKAYNDQFDIGRRSLLDVLDSENEAFQANRSYTNAQYNLKIAQLQTLSSTGQLLPALGIQRDNMPTPSDVSNKRSINNANVCGAAVQASAE
ncbi:TolC family outer membrane protein [Acinetobacter sp. ANC 4173]|uniref:TolC family outer membrane protein n=1 Tax=Acinetobacter sp. ANC 4173 TaxID=2529837 RepID=UPI00104067DB|nr:TolC family outer membrane protein [Acinetobacter sp. ANC 4173]TCB77744.1 hypothetical protein E0H94_14600 [Acinetobacter sp. ANC 4173]